MIHTSNISYLFSLITTPATHPKSVPRQIHGITLAFSAIIFMIFSTTTLHNLHSKVSRSLHRQQQKQQSKCHSKATIPSTGCSMASHRDSGALLLLLASLEWARSILPHQPFPIPFPIYKSFLIPRFAVFSPLSHRIFEKLSFLRLKAISAIHDSGCTFPLPSLVPPP